MASRRDIDTSSRFVPQVAASKSDLLEVITDHWLPILRSEGLWQTGSLCTLAKVFRNIFLWHYPPFPAKAHQA